jgi:hypothetical protein
VDLEDLRLAIYRQFQTTGRAPEPAALAHLLCTTEPDIRAGMVELASQRHLVLDAGGEIVMAHPFSAVPLGFSVMGRTTLWWGGCCWDSFALPHLLPDEPDVLVATRCPGCDRAGAWVVDRHVPPENGWLAHFLVPVAHMWDDVVHSCANQRLFCSDVCLEGWLSRSGYDRGYVMDLHGLWKLARHWYEGRLDRDYVRREPASARDYLRGVGLIDPFWGT